jgi:uncharacterized protein YeaO (DUF488 family)
MAAKRGGGIRLKRAYDPPAKADGTRVLIDRLWPRGVSKEALAIARWVKEIGPSDALRRWFGHDAERWDEFRRRYKAELANQSELLAELRGLARHGTLTLVYAAHDDAHNNAVVLRDALSKAPRAAKKKAPAAARSAAGASKRKPVGLSTRRAASRRARRSPRR